MAPLRELYATEGSARLSLMCSQMQMRSARHLSRAACSGENMPCPSYPILLSSRLTSPGPAATFLKISIR